MKDFQPGDQCFCVCKAGLEPSACEIIKVISVRAEKGTDTFAALGAVPSRSDRVVAMVRVFDVHLVRLRGFQRRPSERVGDELCIVNEPGSLPKIGIRRAPCTVSLSAAPASDLSMGVSEAWTVRAIPSSVSASRHQVPTLTTP